MRLTFAAVAALTLLSLSPANANVIGYELHTPGCDICNFGMAPGESPVVKLYIDDTNFDMSHYPWGVLHASDVVDFTIDAGSFHLSYATQASFYFLTQVIGTDELDGSWMTLFASAALDPDHGNTAWFDSNHWFMGDGACEESCALAGYVGGEYAEGGGDTPVVFFTRITDAPEPLTLSMFAAGLLGLGFRRRQSV